MRIEFLSERFRDQTRELINNEFKDYNPNQTFDDTLICLICINGDDVVVGTISLLDKDLPIHPYDKKGPWIGDLVVLSGFRNNLIATSLFDTLLECVDRCSYLWTSSDYVKKIVSKHTNTKFIETVIYKNKKVSVYYIEASGTGSSRFL